MTRKFAHFVEVPKVDEAKKSNEAVQLAIEIVTQKIEEAIQELIDMGEISIEKDEDGIDIEIPPEFTENFTELEMQLFIELLFKRFNGE